MGRYILEDLVAHTSDSQLWRASDPALNRPVAARLIALDDPRCGAIRQAARRAAAVHDRHIVQVLDVVETDTHLAVITEWVRGRTWNEVLGEDWPSEEIALVALEVGRALQSAHRAGVHHGRIRPASLVITDTNEVRLRGLGVDAALHPGDVVTSPERADVQGVGAVLYSGLTGRWPTRRSEGAVIDGVPAASPVNGILPTPDELASGVPQRLSRIATRCLAGLGAPRGVSAYPDVEHAVVALARAVEESTTTGDAHLAARGPRMRLLVGLAAVIAVLAAVPTGLAVMDRDRGADLDGPAPAVSAGVPEPPSTGGGDAFDLKALPISAVTDFDPFGTDGQENPEDVGRAIDADPGTAWTTVRYRNSDMRPKPGTGLLVDLGIKRPISEVQVLLAGAGTGLEIRYGDRAGPGVRTQQGYALLAGAVGSGEGITLRTPAPVETRYVLLWFTALPYVDGSYQGGVREVRIRG